jgi:hypothetical protein
MENILKSGLTENSVKTVCKSLRKANTSYDIKECEIQMLCLGKIVEKYGGEEFTKDREFLDVFTSLLIEQIDHGVANDLLFERTLFVCVSLISSSSSLINFQRNVSDLKIIDLFKKLSMHIKIDGNRDTQETSLAVLGRLYYAFKKRRDTRINKLKASLSEPLDALFQDDLSLLNTLNDPRQILNQINQSNPNITSVCIESIAVTNDMNHKKNIPALWLDLGQRCCLVEYLNDSDQSNRLMIRYQDAAIVSMANESALEVRFPQNLLKGDLITITYG